MLLTKKDCVHKLPKTLYIVFFNAAPHETVPLDVKVKLSSENDLFLHQSNNKHITKLYPKTNLYLMTIYCCYFDYSQNQRKIIQIATSSVNANLIFFLLYTCVEFFTVLINQIIY